VTGLLTLLAAALAFLALLMVGVWLLSLRLRNAGIVDVAWSAAFTPVVLGYVWLADGWPVRDAILAGMVGLWSLRLAWHLLVRVAREHPQEDSRYARLRREWGASANPRMLVFFQVQAVAALLLTVPFALTALNDASRLHVFEWLGLVVWLTGVVGEAVADRQLSRFRDNPANKGQVCQDGLWRYSRHPNYFFEWVIWCGFGVFALGSPQGWMGIFVVPMMFYVMRFGTGVPYAEASSLASRGDAYREYQRTTNVFFPGPPSPDQCPVPRVR
jgi:steroid 5-alpha reductase family enzyme